MSDFPMNNTTISLPARPGADSNILSKRMTKNLPGSNPPDLNSLRDHVLLMGGEAERAIDEATRALIERDTDLAEQVLRDDDRVDALELEADQLCVRLLGRPVELSL